MTSLFSLNAPISSWAGKRIWIVGASSGIGAALAIQALQAGAKVVLSARRIAALSAVANNHQNAYCVPFDVAENSAWIAAYADICAKLGGVDLVVFCAAMYQPERSWQVQPEQALRTLQINLGSVYAGLATVLPDMLARQNGGIGIVASVAGYMGLPNASVYGPTKAALINLTEILYTDLHPKGLNVYLITPGFVET